MTANEFRNHFWGPANEPNRRALLRSYEIQSFAGLTVRRLGWTGFINALGDKFSLDVRNFTCEAVFLEELASRVKL